MYTPAIVALVFAMVQIVAGHGLVTSPAPRGPGPLMKAACGQGIYNTLSSDPYGNVQGALQNRGTDYNASECKMNLCKGSQLESGGPVQNWSAGTNVSVKVDIKAPHTGVANVNIVNYQTGAKLATLMSWSDYASNSHTIPANQTSFSVTIPPVSNCTVPGTCVMQWWWDAHSINQTYISCVDFTQ
ncbi:hypothetical protein BOTBODRAFT_192293 [Botryobasidium botryosum FD-172 SS1]|uniref:Chitin-binding type-4 domain-containing protein n=1 Tax=Botryobasidium botryosum (strain FD-172 SS1) TaxID=930990 RepID=A0A067M7V3_BOTB1|nr:hypothetical protein BOTBODRAFT_192293 [Botryobasidium botryosum FD-172 SS1]